MVLLTRRNKSLPLEPPNLKGIEITLSTEVKYLGIINIRLIEAEARRKGRRMPSHHSIYTTVVKSLPFYGVTVCQDQKKHYENLKISEHFIYERQWLWAFTQKRIFIVSYADLVPLTSGYKPEIIQIFQLVGHRLKG